MSLHLKFKLNCSNYLDIKMSVNFSILNVQTQEAHVFSAKTYNTHVLTNCKFSIFLKKGKPIVNLHVPCKTCVSLMPCAPRDMKIGWA